MQERDYIEIEPPLIVGTPGLETHIQALQVQIDLPESPRQQAFLHTSPEFALKKILACGIDRVFSLGKVFRNAETTSRHNIEFTMLEWYRRGASDIEMMDETEALVRRVIRRLLGQPRLPSGTDLEPPFQRLSLRETFFNLGIDFDRLALGDAASFARAARDWGVRVPQDEAFDDIFHRVFIEKIEPLAGAVFVYDYPLELGCLARRHPQRPRYAQRFELFIDGLELCNGFAELTDPIEQRARFEAELKMRAQRGLAQYSIDEKFLTALPHMGEAAGNALGFDRLVMLALGAHSIADVIAIPTPSFFTK